MARIIVLGLLALVFWLVYLLLHWALIQFGYDLTGIQFIAILAIILSFKLLF